MVREFISNFLEVLSNWKYFLVFVLSALPIYFIFSYFTDNNLIWANYGPTYYWLLIISQWILVILIPLFITLSLYRFFYFSSFSVRDSSVSGFSAFFAMLAAGCAGCSITLASYLGLMGFISIFPFYGLELKLIAIPLLSYVNYSVLKDLKVCRLKQRKTK